MAEKYKNKYRIESSRLKGWDYTSDGIYYITINTKGRKHFFGEIVDEKMILSDIGKIAVDCYQEIPAHFGHVQLDEWVIMPNHIHGIIIIENKQYPNEPFGWQSLFHDDIIRDLNDLERVRQYIRNNPEKWNNK